MKSYLLTSRLLNAKDNGIYNYCPYCMKKWKEQFKDSPNASYLDSLKPLTYKKYLVLDGKDKHGDDIKYIDEFWECSRCDKKLTTDDFLVYCQSEKKA